ncbi:MAG: hypothetical protein JWQ81_6133 [Amycolatopsis sp.]|uniref:Cap15 family cyclic dinucleotide receptor domain-containing protein n=1 Tax=Amycolatopsis sp. TaxID=37632 RepID=UPI002602D9AC|nr:hypothetical protein [Amycolatopsis sp.]MCU1685394.1 hypothetical protein [Amycolatopsis sp.]
MKRGVLVRVVVGVVVVLLVIQNWLQGGQFNFGLSKIFSTAVLAATLVLALWESWLWRLPLAQRMPGTPRCIRGTWRGVLTTFWVDPKTGKSPDPKTVYLVIRQSASELSVKLLTNESRSASSFASVRLDDGSYELLYLYLNRPDSRYESRSRMHHGSTALDLSGSPVKRLKGRYWTDRDTRGELDFTERSMKIVDDFEEASALFR